MNECCTCLATPHRRLTCSDRTSYALALFGAASCLLPLWTLCFVESKLFKVVIAMLVGWAAKSALTTCQGMTEASIIALLDRVLNALGLRPLEKVSVATVVDFSYASFATIATALAITLVAVLTARLHRRYLFGLRDGEDLADHLTKAALSIASSLEYLISTSMGLGIAAT